MLDLLLTDGMLVTETGTFRGNLGIKDGQIAGLFAAGYWPEAHQVMELKGQVVVPGGIDAHVHIPVGTDTHRGDLVSEGRAALLGGTTTIVDFVKSIDLSLLDTFFAKKEEVSRQAPLDFGFHAVLLHRQDFADIPALIGQGIVSFKQFLCAVDNLPALHTGLLYEAYRILAAHGAMSTVHAENYEIQEYLVTQLKNQGRQDPLAHAEARPVIAELEAVSRMILLARETGTHLHVFHVSSGKTAQLIREAKAGGVRVTAETCPHYLEFTRDDLVKLGPFLQVTPSLKFNEDRLLLWEAVADGTIDILTSDHYAPLKAEKEPGWQNIWPVEGGVPGIETRNPYLLSKGVLEGKLTLERFADLTATMPAKICGFYPRKGAIRIGAAADLAIWNLGPERIISPQGLSQRADWTPFAGAKWKGNLAAAILRGKVVVQEGQYRGQPGDGQFIGREIEAKGARPEIPA